MNTPERWTVRGIIGLALICGLLIIKDGCKKFIPTNPTIDERLKDDEKERVIINDSGDVVHVVRRKGRDGKDQVAYRDTGASLTSVTLNSDGTFKITQRTKGFVFRPGLCLGTSTDGLLVGGDIQFFFIRNFGLNAGVTTTSGGQVAKNVRAHISVSYRLPVSYLRNTSVYAGYDTKENATAGIRIGF